MVIKITDYTLRCYTNKDGKKIFDVIKPLIDDGNKVVISFSGVSGITTSFVNSAFIELLEYFSFDTIKANLHFIDTNKYINQIIKKRFEFETIYRHKLEFKNLTESYAV